MSQKFVKGQQVRILDDEKGYVGIIKSYNSMLELYQVFVEGHALSWPCHEEELEAIEEPQPPPALEEEVPAAKTPDLPELTGSPKQVKWAEDIRSQAVTWVNEQVAQLASRNPTSWANEVLDVAFAIMGEHPEASWWIDHRLNRPVDGRQPIDGNFTTVVMTELQKRLERRKWQLEKEGRK